MPEEAARVARAALPHGTPWLRLRDELGTIYTDGTLAASFPTHGRPAEAPWRLALVTVWQFAEGLSDRQAADAVRARLDWKYPPGLAPWRCAHSADGWKLAGPQPTDSTPVLATVRALNRLEAVAGTLPATLAAPAAAAPDWLRAQVAAGWSDRAPSNRSQGSRLPKGRAVGEQYAATSGADGLRLLEAVDAAARLAWLREVPAVEILRT